MKVILFTVVLWANKWWWSWWWWCKFSVRNILLTPLPSLDSTWVLCYNCYKRAILFRSCSQSIVL